MDTFMFEQTWNDKCNETIRTGEFSTCTVRSELKYTESAHGEHIL